MRGFWEGIQTIFVDYMFAPMDALRRWELSSWFGANLINWIFMIICTIAMVYWVKQLRIFEENNEEVQDTTAHSFLK